MWQVIVSLYIISVHWFQLIYTVDTKSESKRCRCLCTIKHRCR